MTETPLTYNGQKSNPLPLFHISYRSIQDNENAGLSTNFISSVISATIVGCLTVFVLVLFFLNVSDVLSHPLYEAWYLFFGLFAFGSLTAYHIWSAHRDWEHYMAREIYVFDGYVKYTTWGGRNYTAFFEDFIFIIGVTEGTSSKTIYGKKRLFSLGEITYYNRSVGRFFFLRMRTRDVQRVAKVYFDWCQRKGAQPCMYRIGRIPLGTSIEIIRLRNISIRYYKSYYKLKQSTTNPLNP